MPLKSHLERSSQQNSLKVNTNPKIRSKRPTNTKMDNMQDKEVKTKSNAKRNISTNLGTDSRA